MTEKRKKRIVIKDLTGKEVISEKEMKTVMGGKWCKCSTFAGARDGYYTKQLPRLEGSY